MADRPPHRCDDDCAAFDRIGTGWLKRFAVEQGFEDAAAVAQLAQAAPLPGGEFECPVPSAMDDYDRLRRRRGEGMHAPLSKMNPALLGDPEGTRARLLGMGMPGDVIEEILKA